MNALLFDTLRLSRTLRDKGHFTSEQADDLAEALSVATHGDLASKADVTGLKAEVASVKAELKAEISEVRGELKAEIAEVKAEVASVKAELKAEIADVKAEVSSVRAELKAEISVVRAEVASSKAELKTDIADLKAEIGRIEANILKWVVGAIGFQTVATLGTVVALVRIFAR